MGIRQSSTLSVVSSYHPYKVVRRADFLVIICPVAERTVIMVLEVPFLETFSMEDVEAFQFSDFLGTEDRFEADDAGWRLVSRGREFGGINDHVPYELIIGTIRGERRAVSFCPPFLEGSNGRNGVELAQLV